MWLFRDSYTLVTGNITAAGGNANTRVTFQNCTLFTKWITHINDDHANDANNLDITMPMNNLIEYSDIPMLQEVYDNLKETNHL